MRSSIDIGGAEVNDEFLAVAIDGLHIPLTGDGSGLGLVDNTYEVGGVPSEVVEVNLEAVILTPEVNDTFDFVGINLRAVRHGEDLDLVDGYIGEFVERSLTGLFGLA